MNYDCTDPDICVIEECLGNDDCTMREGLIVHKWKLSGDTVSEDKPEMGLNIKTVPLEREIR